MDSQLARASGVQSKGECGRPSTPDEAFYNIPVVVQGQEIGVARLRPDGTLTISSNGRSEMGAVWYRQMRAGQIKGLSLRGWTDEGALPSVDGFEVFAHENYEWLTTDANYRFAVAFNRYHDHCVEFGVSRPLTHDAFKKRIRHFFGD